LSINDLTKKFTGYFLSGVITVTVPANSYVIKSFAEIFGQTIPEGHYITGLVLEIISGEAVRYMTYTYVRTTTFDGVYINNAFSANENWQIVVRATIVD